MMTVNKISGKVLENTFHTFKEAAIEIRKEFEEIKSKLEGFRKEIWGEDYEEVFLAGKAWLEIKENFTSQYTESNELVVIGTLIVRVRSEGEKRKEAFNELLKEVKPLLQKLGFRFDWSIKAWVYRVYAIVRLGEN